MKKLASTLLLLTASSGVFAQQLSPENSVLRPITLADGEVQIAGSLAYGEQQDDEKDWQLGVYAAYGITEDLTIDTLGLRYRLLERANNGTGLELSSRIGAAGYYETFAGDDTLGWGLDVVGKYVISRDTALLFSAEYVLWDEEHRENRKEYRYSAGIQQNIAPDLTLSASYTYRDLKDFEQDDAFDAEVRANYALDKQWDLGAFVGYSDFEPAQNGYKPEDVLDKMAGVYVSYRF